MKEYIVGADLKPQSYPVIGTKVQAIKRSGGYVQIENETSWAESIMVTTDYETIKVVVHSKGRWSPLVNQETRKPYGFVFKKDNKPSAVNIIIVDTK
ncbi:MAG: hypothetical protein IKA30_02975 [Alphaproteobacteria bacterium]|nr:hypothetical protein [Alphaproteobacteria bacterium]